MKLLKYKIAFLFWCCIAFASQLQAQSSASLSSQLKKASHQFKSLQYDEAIRQLSLILKTDSTQVKAQEMLAYSYKEVKNYEGALKWYKKLTANKPLKPEWALYYAEALANHQQYESSEGWYRKYFSLVPADKRAAAFARSNSKTFYHNIGNWVINFTNINTQSSEYAPVFYKDGLIFSSNRPTAKINKRVFLWDNTPFTNLYAINKLSEIKAVNPDSLKKAVKNNSSKAIKFNDDDTAPTSNDTKNLGIYASSILRDTLRALLEHSIHPTLLSNKVNTKFHDATAAIFPDGSIIFTRNNYFKGHTQTSLDGINKLKLFTATGDHLSKMTEFPYNSNEYSTGHPTLNHDGTILVFASDMPGGYGGTDLYYSVRSGDGHWTRPINLGKQINTEGNEMFPFLDKKGSLYFSSTGYAGLGGLDLFEVPLKEMKPVSPPKNMGSPINSSKDDFSLVKNEDGKIGFFSSNRKGSDDIYQFKRAFQLIILEGMVTDAITRIPIVNGRIFMRHLDGIDTLITDVKGKYRRELPRETDYELTGSKPGYINRLSFVTSQGIEVDSVIRHDIILNRTESRQQFVLNNCDSLKKVFSIKNIYYDLDRSEIRRDAIPALDELYILMKNHPEITIITSSHCDSRASNDYNRNLSLRRGAAARTYLVNKGIAANRISVEYYGKTRLINRCFDGVPCSEEDQQLNRRTEFEVILRGINLTQQNCDEI